MNKLLYILGLIGIVWGLNIHTVAVPLYVINNTDRPVTIIIPQNKYTQGLKSANTPNVKPRELRAKLQTINNINDFATLPQIAIDLGISSKTSDRIKMKNIISGDVLKAAKNLYTKYEEGFRARYDAKPKDPKIWIWIDQLRGSIEQFGVTVQTSAPKTWMEEGL